MTSAPPDIGEAPVGSTLAASAPGPRRRISLAKPVTRLILALLADVVANEAGELRERAAWILEKIVRRLRAPTERLRSRGQLALVDDGACAFPPLPPVAPAPGGPGRDRATCDFASGGVRIE